MGGILVSWPFILALTVYVLVKSGYGHRVYIATFRAELIPTDSSTYHKFLKAYSGQLTLQVVDSEEHQYIDILGKTRAIHRTREEKVTYFISHTWWRRESAA